MVPIVAQIHGTLRRPRGRRDIVSALPAWWLTVRSILEALYFASGVAIAIAAFKALDQIRLARGQLTVAADALAVAKGDIALRVQREAIVQAAQQCDRFADEIIPRLYAWQQAIREAGGTSDERWQLNDQEFAWTSFADRKAAEKWQKDPKTDGASNPAIKALNGMEAFAVYFVKGAADETVAFPSAGKVFCDYVEALAPILVALIEKGKNEYLISGPFENVVSLYKLWSVRVKRGKLEEEAKGLGLTVEGERKSLRPIGSG